MMAKTRHKAERRAPTGRFNPPAFDVASLVPDAYADYRPIVADAFRFFVEHLSPRRAEAIVSEQLNLPGATTMADRLVALMRRCPALHKLGQVVARDRRLSEELRDRLKTLEKGPSAMTPGEAVSMIERELPDAVGVIEVGSSATHGEPIEGSVAVVVPVQWEGRDGVLKILKPGIADRLDEDLQVLGQLGRWLDEQCESQGLPSVDYGDTFDSVRDLLASEVRLDGEQEHLRLAADFYAGRDRVHIPRLWPFCTPRVTAMERLDGRCVTEFTGDRRALAALIVDALIARPMWSAEPDALFHADPHAGNLLAAGDGDLGILDWSLVGRLAKADRERLVRIALGGLTLDPARIAGAIAELSIAAPNESELRYIADRAVAEARRGGMPGLDWLVAVLDDAVQHSRARFGPQLLMFRKSLLTLEGVVADVSPDCRPDGVLAAAALGRLASEWPSRLSATPFGRDFATHISNADLAAVLWSAPAVAARFWMGAWQDVLRATTGSRP